MVLPELSRTMACLQHATQSTAVESYGTRTIKGGINLHSVLQKHKLGQIAQEKHKDFSRQEYSFLEVATASPKENVGGQIRSYP